MELVIQFLACFVFVWPALHKIDQLSVQLLLHFF